MWVKNHNRISHTPLYGEVVITLGFRGNVLPELVGRQAGPGRVVTIARDPVAALTAFAPWHQLISGQVSHGVREGAQEAVQEMAHRGWQRWQFNSLHGQRGEILSMRFSQLWFLSIVDLSITDFQVPKNCDNHWATNHCTLAIRKIGKPNFYHISTAPSGKIETI